MRHSQIIFLCSFLLVLVGCHNNAHLRTQKVLKPGEKAYSASGVLAMGSETRYGRLDYTGVPGIRGEVSMLTGRKGGEAGPYLGFGLNGDEDKFVFTGGFEYKQYRISGSGAPKKLGIQGELNYTPKGDRGAYGSTLHFRPSFTTTTTKEKYFYSGIHGVLAIGSLYDNVHYNSKDYFGYDFNSLGLGITAGVEFLLPSSSIQIQIDASLLRNTYASDEPSFGDGYYYNYYDDDEPSQSTFLATGSIGMSFFKPDPKRIAPLEPFPVPSYRPLAPPPEKIIYDPETGLPVPSEPEEPEMEFDPETGEMIQKDTETSYDPETGELIKTNREIIHDPETGMQNITPYQAEELSYGELVFQAQNAAKRLHNKGLYQSCGAGSCVIYPIGIPAAILYVETGAFSNLNLYDPFYLDLNTNQKIVYKSTYKKEEKKLRRKAIYNTQLGCIVAFFGLMIMG